MCKEEKLSIDERIAKIEKHYHPGAVPVTVLIRTMRPEGGFGWSLGIGSLFFTGATIEEVLTKAEAYLKAAVKHYATKTGQIGKFAERYGVVATALSDLVGGEMFERND